MSFNYDHKAIQMRRGTSSEWREYGDKCVPLEAEICVELMQYPDGTINKSVGVKVGNGIDSYEQLPYVILNEEVDPVFTNHPAYEITQDMIDMWNQASVEPGEEYGQVTRWDGTEWIPSSIILLKDVEGIEVHRNVVPDRKSSLDIGAPNLTFKNGYFDNLETGSINVEGNATIGGNIDVDGSINIDGNIIGGDGGINIGVEIDNINEEITNINGSIESISGDLEQEINDRIEGDELLQEALEGVAGDLAQEISDRQDGDAALDKRIDELATDDLTDVNSDGATKDQFLIHNGSQWIAEDFHIDTELTFKGGISVPNDSAPAATNGDLYINNEDGVAGSSWTGIAGRTINAANAVGWSDTNARWYILGDIASAAVMAVEAGIGIDVEDSKPAEPVVSIDRDEVDKWYEPPIDPKRSAFNKNFGSTAGTVAEGNHNHDYDYADINHNHSGVYEPVINPKNTAFNKNFGTTAGTVAEGNHTHSQYLTGFTETDPTVPSYVKGITQTDINNWNNAAGGGAYTLPLAANGTRGGVQVGYGTNGKNYAVQLSGEKMFVSVPWTDTTTDLTGYATQSWVSANYQPKGNYALVGDSYTKAESDGKYELKGEGGGGGSLPAGDWICEGNIYAKGNITAFWTSDENKKTDIAPMPLGLIDGINPVTFKWKDSGKASAGVIAQQLQACGLDDWVNEAPDKTLGVDYMALIGVLLAEVQDLKLRVKELEG